jgi:hypothetical protein
MRTKVILIACAVAISLLYHSSQSSLAKEEKLVAEASGPFQNKLILLKLRSSDTFGAELVNVTEKKLGDKTFLVGTGAATKENWQAGNEVWISADDISVITVFKSLDDFTTQFPDRLK